MLAALTILATLPAGIAIPASAAATGSISGTVTVPAGVDVTGLAVNTVSGPTYKYLPISADGKFTLTGLEAGKYKLNFSTNGGPEQVYRTFYGGLTFSAATVIDVGEGQSVTGITQALKAGGKIRGAVALPEGVSAKDISVSAGSSTYSDEATPSADGTFEVGPLAPGTYQVSFSARIEPSPVVPARYTAGASQPKDIAISEGTTATGVNQTLKPAAFISGILSVPTGGDPFNGYVEAVSTTTPNSYAGSAEITSGGTYTVGGLEAGTYKLRFSSFNVSTYANMWHGGVPIADSSPAVTVSAAQKLTGLSDVAVKAATITGTATPPAADKTADVQAISADGQLIRAGQASPGSASFTINGLFPGTYKVQFNRSSGVATTSEGQFYKNLPESKGAAAATPVTVTAGQTVSNINATAQLGGTLTGKIIGSAGTPLNNVPIRVYTKDGSLATRGAQTAADGTFKVTGLSTGNYLVSANMLAATPGPIFSGNTLTEANAMPVGVTVGKNTDLGTLSYATPGGSTPTFSDVPAGSQFSTEIRWLAENGISTGWTEADGSVTFRPLQPVNRDAMAAFMYRLAGKPAFTAPAVSPFADVPAGAQFYKEITWLAAQGISTGWSEADQTKTYRPLEPVNRDAMAAFMYRYNTKFGSK